MEFASGTARENRIAGGVSLFLGFLFAGGLMMAQTTLVKVLIGVVVATFTILGLGALSYKGGTTLVVAEGLVKRWYSVFGVTREEVESFGEVHCVRLKVENAPLKNRPLLLGITYRIELAGPSGETPLLSHYTEQSKNFPMDGRNELLTRARDEARRAAQALGVRFEEEFPS